MPVISASMASRWSRSSRVLHEPHLHRGPIRERRDTEAEGYGQERPFVRGVRRRRRSGSRKSAASEAGSEINLRCTLKQAEDPNDKCEQTDARQRKNNSHFGLVGARLHQGRATLKFRRSRLRGVRYASSLLYGVLVGTESCS